MKKTKKEQMMHKILAHVKRIDIAGYLTEEVEGFLKYLHFYKLKNIAENMDALKEYLLFLDHQSTLQMRSLDYDLHFQKPTYNTVYNVYYYVSKRGLDVVGEDKLMKKIWENDYNLMTVMQGIKGFLLLTVDEFCNASPTRMFINRAMWKKELIKVEAKEKKLA